MKQKNVCVSRGVKQKIVKKEGEVSGKDEMINEQKNNVSGQMDRQVARQKDEVHRIENDEQQSINKKIDTCVLSLIISTSKT